MNCSEDSRAVMLIFRCPVLYLNVSLRKGNVLRRLCSEDNEFLQKCQEMTTFFESRGYPSDLLQNARQRVSSVTR
jgi:hypothetical protein